MNDIRNVVLSYTTPVPKLRKSDPGVMTRAEFLKYRNPQDKYHGSDSYTFTLKSMNKDYRMLHIGETFTGNGIRDTKLSVHESKGKGFMFKDPNEHHALRAILHKGTLYYDQYLATNEIPEYYFNRDHKSVDLSIKRKKKVKYISEYANLVYDVAERNTEGTHLHQRIKIRGEPFEIRFSEEPVLGKGVSISVLNSSGEEVASVTDEWGATLVGVAKEYRGKGLGKIVTKLWYEWNPAHGSGGFTGAGQENAIRVWEDRVREFLSKGWYSELIKENTLTKEKVQDILSGLSTKVKFDTSVPVKTKDSPLVMIIDDVAFCVYDEAFFEDPTEDNVYAHGFFRASGGKTFLYSIDYDRKYRKLATYIALQMARDEGIQLYNGEGYSDILELEGLDNVEQNGDYVSLTKDMLPIAKLSRIEQAYRKPRDKYREMEVLIMEAAESKDWNQ